MYMVERERLRGKMKVWTAVEKRYAQKNTNGAHTLQAEFGCSSLVVTACTMFKLHPAQLCNLK
jgi:hypothetical protein